MDIRPARPGDREQLVRLIGQYRAALAEIRGQAAAIDAPAAEGELAEYQQKGFPIFVAAEGAGKIVGYLVCRIDGKVLWAESLFVLPAFRRRGIASALYAEAERLAESLGGETVYNWVDPDNDAIVAFLARRGYDVLNLIELRRPRPGERPGRRIRVGGHEFRQ